MDSEGRVRKLFETPQCAEGAPRGPVLVTGEVMPAACRRSYTLKAMDDLRAIEGEVSVTHPALVPLTPFERGWVLGMRSACAKKAESSLARMDKLGTGEGEP